MPIHRDSPDVIAYTGHDRPLIEVDGAPDHPGWHHGELWEWARIDGDWTAFVSFTVAPAETYLRRVAAEKVREVAEDRP